MPAHLDHLVVVAPTLAAGAELVHQALGVRPGPGRRHPHMGTHNLLLALGPLVYLEVVAIDPDAPPVARRRWFGLDQQPPPAQARLAAWVARCDDIRAAARPELGAVERMEREGRGWWMTATADGRPPLDGAAPLLIQRDGPGHPAAQLPDHGLRWRRLDIRHPRPSELSAVLTQLGLAPTDPAATRHGDEPGLAIVTAAVGGLLATIDTPDGPRTLGGA